MKKFIKSFFTLFLVYALYKIALFSLILTIQLSPYNVNPNEVQNDYGVKTDKGVVIGGSSNTRYNYDYAMLNNGSMPYSFRSCSVSSPYGLYFTVKKIRMLSSPSDIILLDIPYTLYSKDQFLPLTEYTLDLMRPGDYVAVFKVSPLVFFDFIFQESVFNPKVLGFITDYIKHRRDGKKTNAQQSDFGGFPAISEKQRFDAGYDSCNYPYNAYKHFINDVDLEDGHLEKIRIYIAENLAGRVYFSFPEINKRNHKISPRNIERFQKYFKPINPFLQSEYENKYMFDQQYHLNKCGAAVNTGQMITDLSEQISLKNN